MKHTNVRKKDLAALPHAKLVDVVMEIATTADDATSQYDEGFVTAEARDLCVITPGTILDLIESAVDDTAAVASQARTRAANAAYWNETLPELLDERFDDGSLVIEYVLASNPGLALRLRKALGL